MKRADVENQILCGDCVQFMNTIPENTVRLVVADPPYFNVLLGENWDTAVAQRERLSSVDISVDASRHAPACSRRIAVLFWADWQA
jgi:DNA modification methylase